MNTSKLLQTIDKVDPHTRYGKVRQIVGLIVEAAGPEDVALGELCYLGDPARGGIRAEVVGFNGGRVLLTPLGEIEGIRPGTAVFPTRSPLKIAVSKELRGRILNGLGNPLDGRGQIHAREHRNVNSPSPDPLSRRRLSEPLGTGVRSIDGLMTLGRGQRMGIFAGSGVGKSTLLGMVARYSEADVNVIALVGERGKEVIEFIEDSLGEDGLNRSVVVVATSDQPALIRLKAALVATTIAEYFRDDGKDVMLMMDSLTRMAMAQREIGLAAGDPPTTKGYTPSVFAMLPKLLERVGTTQSGSITGLYTVLVEGDDLDDPIADSSRALLDGHIVLSRRLASRGHYPPVDIGESISRSMRDVASTEHMEQAIEVKAIVAAYQEAEDLVSIGAYARGSNAQIDRALEFIGPINDYLRQGIHAGSNMGQHVQQLLGLLQPRAEEAEVA